MFDNNTHKTLTKKQAYQYLDIGREQFNAELKKGNISFLPCGKRIKFTIEALEKWRSNTINHIDYTSEEIYTTPTSRSSHKPEKEYSLERLHQERQRQKLSNIVSKGLQTCKRKAITNKLGSCQA